MEYIILLLWAILFTILGCDIILNIKKQNIFLYTKSYHRIGGLENNNNVIDIYHRIGG